MRGRKLTLVLALLTFVVIGLSLPGSLRDAYERHPHMHAATYLVPQGDAAGTAANLALHLAAGAR